MESLRPATRVVHDGRPAKTPDAPLNTPITMASTYVGGGDWEYGRFTNPTWSAFEETLGSLEGGRALAFSSGQAATSVLLDLVADSTVVCGQAYNGTISQLVDLQARQRLRASLVDITDLEAVRAAIDDDTALLWIESPTNPGMAVADLPALIAMAHEAGVRVVVDNTFATPLLQQPLALGADIVLHSVTKFLAGHSDVTMGAIVVDDDDLFKVIKGRRDLLGPVAGPFETWLALRGMRTLALRIERASANARELARHLRAEGVDVRDPGFGAMLAIVLPTAEAGEWVERRVRLWTHATSLGGVESTLERRRRWVSESPDVPEGLVRLSVGIEDVEDLWADLHQAIKAALA